MSLKRKVQRLKSFEQFHRQSLQQLQQKRLFLGLSAFALFVASQIVGGFHLEWIALLVFIPLFLFFLKKSRRKRSFVNEITSRLDFYQRHLNFNNGIFNDSILAEQMQNPSLARDLDLGVLFSSLDFSFSKQGRNQLDEWLCQIFSTSTFKERRAQLQELASHPCLLRKLQSRPKSHSIDFERISAEVERSFFPESMKWKWLIPISWLTLLVFVIISAPAFLWKATLLIYIGSMLSYMGQTKFLFSRLQDLHQDFEQLQVPVNDFENLAQKISFAPHLKKREASRDTQSLARSISLMSLKTNPILFYILNLILPWDFILAEWSEKARKGFSAHFAGWSQEIVRLEALSSLVNLKHYQNTVWPTLSDKNSFVEVKDLSHPLLNQESVVTNSFNPQKKRIIIITGSNMSGKSTFLRALGMNLCLANIGAPVFAREMAFLPMDIVTCIRVSDSLRDGQSYFYAEVQRMKNILQRAKSHPVFFLIDEPLRGTNNQERLVGNQSYLRQILQTQANGFLCTHDLELTQLADESEQIENYHFSEQWENQNLYFDYKIKNGPSTTTNALKILEKEGLFQPQKTT